MVAIACGGGDTALPPESVASVALTPATQTLQVGDTLRVSATVRGSRGTTLADRRVSWSSSDASRATVAPTGTVTAVAPGAVIISASSEGVVGTAAFTVAPIPVANVVVTPAAATAIVGNTVTLTATARSAAGAALSDRSISWRSSDVTRATVSGAGVVSTLAPGAVTVTATIEGRSGSAVLTIVPVPVATVTVTPGATALLRRDTLRLSATARDSAGGALPGRTITWSSADTTVLQISAQGVATGVREGTATVIATSEGRSGTAAVRVLPALTVRVIQDGNVTNGLVIVRTSDTVQVRASVDSSGTFLVVPPVAFVWTSADTLVANVSADGRVSGRREGITTLRVRTIRGALDSVPLRVFARANVTEPPVVGPADRSVFSDPSVTQVPLEWSAVPLSLTVQAVEIDACVVPAAIADWDSHCAVRWAPNLRVTAFGRFVLARRQGFAYRWRVRAFDLVGAYGPWSPWRSLIFR